MVNDPLTLILVTSGTNFRREALHGSVDADERLWGLLWDSARRKVPFVAVLCAEAGQGGLRLSVKMSICASTLVVTGRSAAW